MGGTVPTYDVSQGAPEWRALYPLFLGFINPRPIALVSSVSPDGVHNLAPFSFYNMVCPRPPVVMFAPGFRRDGSAKDTLDNVRATGEFSIATVTEHIAQQAVDCAADVPRDASEFDFSGLDRMPARHVRAPLVKDAVVNIECRLRDIVSIESGPGGACVVLGDVLALHIDDAILDREGRIDPHRLRTVGRLGGKWYCTVSEPYELLIPPYGNRDLKQR